MKRTAPQHETSQHANRYVLVVDDHASAREAIADVLRHAAYDVTTCASAVEALVRLECETIHLVITDLQMPGMDGLQFIREIKRKQLDIQVLMITAHGSITTAVEAMRHGAFDFIEKPFDAIQLEQSVDQAWDRRRLCENSGSPAMIGSSRAMQTLRQSIAQIAPTDETVLICGESGTGKELVAQAIHAQSTRKNGPLVSLNCPALSTQLTESELFGHQRGAFTGAEADRTGRFEQANGGSIFLDEITEIELGLQAKLLRVLQERSFERVGSNETISVDVRVLATTNRSLQEEVAAGRFREDLYYRLAVVPICLPPLRERGDDPLELANYFLDHAAKRLGRDRSELEPAALELLAEYPWPGNVRELQNVVTRACVLNPGQLITADQLRPWLLFDEETKEQESQPLPLGMTLEEIERHMIVATLEQFEGHRAKTAEALGIGVRTLSGKLRTYGYAPREKNFAKVG